MYFAHMNFGRKLQYVENAIIDDRAFVLLHGYIGYTNDADGLPMIFGSQFADEMYYLKSLGLQITVKINSPGGRTFDMMTICDAIETCKADTLVIGMAASAAGIISQYGAKRFMYDIATLMVHPLQKNGADDQFTDILRNQIKSMLMKRSKLSEAQVDEMLKDGGKDHWFDASDANNAGLVDEVLISNKPKVENLKNLWKEKNSLKLVSIYNSINSHNTDEEMKSLKTLLGLPEDATESKVMEVVGELQISNKKLKTDNAALVVEKDTAVTAKTTLEGELKTFREEAAQGLIDQAVADGVIEDDETKKKVWKEMAVTNYANTKSLLGGVKPTHQSVTNVTDPAKKETPAVGGKKVVKTDAIPSFEKLQEENPEELARIEKEQPELFEKMVDAYVKPANAKAVV